MSPRKDPKTVGRAFWAWETAGAKAWTWVLGRGDQGRRRLGYQRASKGQAQETKEGAINPYYVPCTAARIQTPAPPLLS